MFQSHHSQNYLTQISRPSSPVVDALKRNIFVYSFWLLGIPAFFYGAADRGLVAFTKPSLQVTDVSCCMIALIALLGWLVIGIAIEPLKQVSQDEQEHDYLNDVHVTVDCADCIAQQKYRLPFPFWCQIYHLLNLKHLEDIHRFSLGNLKVTKVSQFKPTQQGGWMRFKTVLDSPLNVLRMWRNPSAEVDLILHAPHQIELKVPVYQQKYIHVLFNILPLNAEEHILSIQMFSDLQWPRELLRPVLMIAASLTLLEDWPYLSQLANRKMAFSSQTWNNANPPHAMQLLQRYVHLYGRHWEQKSLGLPHCES
jgi:hypothetical protein